MAREWMLAVAVALTLVSVAPQANGAGGTPITSCGQTVTTNAFLSGSLYCPGSAGIVVGAAGITIDLKGFRLLGTGVFNGVAVNGFDDVTIKNGVISSFSFGIRADNSN